MRSTERKISVSAAQSWRQRFALAAADLGETIHLWRLVLALSLMDIKLSYRGSLLGPHMASGHDAEPKMGSRAQLAPRDAGSHPRLIPQRGCGFRHIPLSPVYEYDRTGAGPSRDGGSASHADPRDEKYQSPPRRAGGSASPSPRRIWARPSHLWRLVLALSFMDIKLRYRGSLLGPFWLTLSTAVMIGAIGFLYAGLFHQNVSKYLPFLSISIDLLGVSERADGRRRHLFHRRGRHDPRAAYAAHPACGAGGDAQPVRAGA